MGAGFTVDKWDKNTLYQDGFAFRGIETRVFGTTRENFICNAIIQRGDYSGRNQQLLLSIVGMQSMLARQKKNNEETSVQGLVTGALKRKMRCR